MKQKQKIDHKVRDYKLKQLDDNLEKLNKLKQEHNKYQ